MMTDEMKLLHTLWSKAVGTEGYSKAEWVKLAKVLEEKQRTDDRKEERRSRIGLSRKS